MLKYVVEGPSRLEGRVRVRGAKNAVLPILCATLLCNEGEVTLTNCPDISDVTYTLEILKKLGCFVSASGEQITVCAKDAFAKMLDCDEVCALRSSSLFLGAACGRFGYAKQCMSGGCELGARPIDMHLDAFEKMGIECKCEGRFTECAGCAHSADITLRFASVGATENIILAAAKSKARVTVRGCAREPEIVDLANFINAMGGKIFGAGSDTIVIEGVEKLRGINYNIIGDRIEAATYMAAALATNGKITVSGANFFHLGAFLDFVSACGGAITLNGSDITVCRACSFLLPVGILNTAPYPAYPTDAQALAMCVLVLARGKSIIRENIFSSRFRLADELCKLGADIEVCGNCAKINGVGALCGTTLDACDLRAGAAAVISALCANGTSEILNAQYVLRGYSNFDTNLCALGARITKIEEQTNATTKSSSCTVLQQKEKD